MKLQASLFCLAVLGAGLAQADMRVAETPLTDAELAQLRGGFLMDGLEIAIGLEQVVAVNGETRVINRIQIPNLNQPLSAGQLQRVESLWVSEGVDQPGLRLSSGTVGRGGWMTVLQNSLNGATIQQIRQLNIELNNLGGVYRLPRDAGLPLLP